MQGKPDSGEKPATRLRRRAMDLLARREHTFDELLQKLAVRFPDEDETLMREVLQQLQRDNLLSDERFMESWLNSRQRAGMGPLKIGSELRQKGVDSRAIDQLMSTIPPEHWLELAQDILTRKFSGSPLTTAEKQKAWRFLMQRGFDGEIIAKALKGA